MSLSPPSQSATGSRLLRRAARRLSALTSLAPGGVKSPLLARLGAGRIETDARRAPLFRPPPTAAQRRTAGASLRPARGFTLLETLISAALLMMVITGVVSAFTGISRSFEHQRHFTRAMALGESQLESLLQRYQDHADLQSTAHPTLHFDIEGKPVGSASTYAVDWTVSSTTFGMRRIRVTVSWKEGSAQVPRSISFQTLRK